MTLMPLTILEIGDMSVSALWGIFRQNSWARLLGPGLVLGNLSCLSQHHEVVQFCMQSPETIKLLLHQQHFDLKVTETLQML